MKKYFYPLDLYQLAALGLLVAISVILQKISFGSNLMEIGIGFIATVLLGKYFGPVWGGIGAGIADVLNAAIFGVNGGFFIGFTISAITAGVIYGFFFYQQPIQIWRIIVATLLVTVVVNVFMNTLWVSMMYGANFYASLSQRIIKELIVPWIQMIIIWLVLNATKNVKIKPD